MSIFSINDNSNYGSILSQAKANKDSNSTNISNSSNTNLSINNATKQVLLIMIYQVNLKTLFIL